MSRFKDTRVFDDNEGNGQQFGLMEPPPEFEADFRQGEARRHTVRFGEVGFLDRLAVDYFGEGQEELWWIIALVNGIIDPDYDMYPGQTLLIPPAGLVSTFTGRSGNA